MEKFLSWPIYMLTDAETDADHKRFRDYGRLGPLDLPLPQSPPPTTLHLIPDPRFSVWSTNIIWCILCQKLGVYKQNSIVKKCPCR